MEENHVFVREEALQEQEGNASHLCVNDHARLLSAHDSSPMLIPMLILSLRNRKQPVVALEGTRRKQQ
jgi:hypothetical protein